MDDVFKGRSFDDLGMRIGDIWIFEGEFFLVDFFEATIGGWFGIFFHNGKIYSANFYYDLLPNPEVNFCYFWSQNFLIVICKNKLVPEFRWNLNLVTILTTIFKDRF